jgi:hypothetical protein
MDPYIESAGMWRNFHANLLIKIQDTLADLVPRHYLVRAEERSYFVENEVRETFIDIFATEPEHRLVATIEVLSPTNKERGGYGWELYLRKRQAALVCGVHLVEIDLLRGGTRLPMRDPWPESPYTLLVARAGQQFTCEVWPAYFHLPVPVIPIPLAAPDADVALALQPLIDSIYSRLRYDETIDYGKPLVPALTGAEVGWLNQVRK